MQIWFAYSRQQYSCEFGFYTSTRIQFLYHVTANDSWVLGSLGQVPDTGVSGSPVSKVLGPQVQVFIVTLIERYIVLAITVIYISRTAHVYTATWLNFIFNITTWLWIPIRTLQSRNDLLIWLLDNLQGFIFLHLWFCYDCHGRCWPT